MKAPPFLQGKITFENQVVPGFAAEVAAIPGGEGIFECLQCGTCSGVCSVAPYMDYTPRRLINMVRAGFKDEVLHSRTVWLCTGCYACAVNCPAGIHITDVMYALKRLAIRNGSHPRRFPIPVLVSEFIRNVRRTGRSNEAELVVRVAMKVNPLRLLRAAPTGLKLLRTGRMHIRGAKIEDPRRLDSMLESVSEAGK
ncbi:MAG: 4Fe-4S dicluster domain-containing protein [Dehalococcoidia bacterium]|nr:4Fe-4S dicluster domain-containing protein [Dehalococcoidia bacterium]